MGLDTQLFQASGDGGIDCMAYDPDPIKGGKIAVQTKLYNRTVPPTHVTISGAPSSTRPGQLSG
jgi:restriction system protein